MRSCSPRTMWERSSSESSKRPSSNSIGPDSNKFSLRKRSFSGRRRSLETKRPLRSQSVASDGKRHSRSVRRKRKGQGAARSLLDGADDYGNSSVELGLRRSTSASITLTDSRGHSSVADASAEDEECAAIIQAVKDCVTAYNIRNPSPPPSDVDRRESILPVVLKPIDPDIRYITSDTLCDIITGRFNHAYSRVHIIDCRFDYEYKGGHIRNAINISEPNDAIARFFREMPERKIA